MRWVISFFKKNLDLANLYLRDLTAVYTHQLNGGNLVYKVRDVFVVCKSAILIICMALTITLKYFKAIWTV